MRRIIGVLIIAAVLCCFGGAELMAAESYHVVEQGDSLWSIANHNGVSVDYLKRINGLNSDFLKLGQKLVIKPESKQSGVQTPPTSRSGATTVYVVKSGDSLWSIASQYKISVAALKELNQLSSDFLQIGQSLKVTSGAVSRAAANPTPSRSGTGIDGNRIIELAANYLGTRYAYGGQSPSGFDCSGFTSYIFKQCGYSLPRTAASQFEVGQPVDKDNLVAGDLVFFNCGGGSTINHVGIYCSNGQFIHSSSPSSGGVIYSTLLDGYHATYYAGARRILP